MRLEVIAQSRGKFKCSNRDSHIARAFGDDYFLAAVADGMDGDKGYGDRMKVARASRAAIKFLEQSVQHDKDRPLKEIVEETEQRMLGSRLSKETTLTTVSIREGYLEIAQLGDSVAYLFRDGEAIRLVNQQTDRQLLEIVFGKHPSKITLEELLQVFNRNSQFYSGIINFDVLTIGIDLYNCSNSSLAEWYPVDEELKKQVRKIFGDKPIMYESVDDLPTDRKMAAKKIFAKIAYSWWNKLYVMVHHEWDAMYSALSYDKKVIVTIDTFSPKAAELVEDGAIKLKKDDVLVIASDGAFYHIGNKYVHDGSLKYYPGANWDYEAERLDRIAAKLMELLQQNPKKAFRDAIKQKYLDDDATLIVVRYRG